MKLQKYIDEAIQSLVIFCLRYLKPVDIVYIYKMGRVPPFSSNKEDEENNVIVALFCIYKNK